MSCTLAASIALAMYAVAFAPLGLAYYKPGAAAAVALLYGLPLLGVGIYHAGGVPTSMPSGAAGLQAAPESLSSAQCGEILALLERGGIILDRTAPRRLVVDGGQWSQVPQQIRDTVVTCVETARPARSGGGAIEVIQR
jgi:hypothetical protein